ncbi:MAG: hypothetical protein WC421_01460 [Elusimicrobiales bacterium]
MKKNIFMIAAAAVLSVSCAAAEESVFGALAAGARFAADAAAPPPVPLFTDAAPAVVFVPDYWPQPASGKPAVFNYFNKGGLPANMTSVFSRQPDGTVWQDDYLNGKWKDRWLLRYDPLRGVVEFGDDYPSSGAEAAILGPVKKMRFRSGGEILWGGHQPVGGKLECGIYLDVLASHMLPGQAVAQKGHQSVWFAKVLPFFEDVLGRRHGETLMLFYQQDWNGGVPIGALYWMEKGVGPVQLQWAGNYQLVGEPMAAAPQ